MEDIEISDDIDDIEVIYSDGEDEDLPEDGSNLQVTDLSKLTFSKHSNAVFCGSLSKNGQYAVTGGQDDMAYVWSTLTGELILECTGHKDSVIEVCFNHDDQLLATGDMAGMIQVWSIKEKKLIWCDEGDDLEWLLWHHLANVLLVGSRSGCIYFFQVPNGNRKVLASHGASCTSGKLLPDGKHLVAGYIDGQVKMWDLKTTNVEWSHSSGAELTSIQIDPQGSLISLAPTSSLLKASDGKPINTFLPSSSAEIEAHAFNMELNILVTGSLNGDLCVWDLAKQVIRHQASIECAVTVLTMGSDGKLFVGGGDGAIYVCDIRSGTLIETLTGHTAEVFSLSLSSDGHTLLSTSDDTTAKIFIQKQQ